jgi:hypothetical protein
MAKTHHSLMHSQSLILFLILILVASCGAKDQLVGSYRAEEKDLSGQVETMIELKPNGEGTWKSGSEEIPFSWYLKGPELRINTKEGGVIVGGLEKDTIHMTLPGDKKMTFRKIH